MWGPGDLIGIGAHGSFVGSGYTSPPAVVLINIPSGLGEEFEMSISSGSISGGRVVNPGPRGRYFPVSSASCRFEPRSGQANCLVTVRGVVTDVELTDRGRGYREPPNVTITRTGSNGHGAAAMAVLRGPTGNSHVENLFWGRQALYGKELLIEVAAAEE